jgi:cytochrome c biogenesis factor
VNADPGTGRVALLMPGLPRRGGGKVLAVEVSTNLFINLVWLGSILMLASALLSALRRARDLKAPEDATAT